MGAYFFFSRRSFSAWVPNLLMAMSCPTMSGSDMIAVRGGRERAEREQRESRERAEREEQAEKLSD